MSKLGLVGLECPELVTDVFISHSRASTEAAKMFADALRARGVSPWLDEENIVVGHNLVATIHDALNASRAVVFLIEPERVPSPWVRSEWSAALESAWAQPNKRLIPILMEGAAPPPFLRTRNALRVKQTPTDLERAADKVADALRDERNPLGAVEPSALAAARGEWRRRMDEIEVAAKNLGRE